MIDTFVLILSNNMPLPLKLSINIPLRSSEGVWLLFWM